MASGNGVSSNFNVLSVLGLWRSVLTAGSILRLYSNNTVPSPADTWASYTECTFTGYAAVPLTGLYPTPTLIANGEYNMVLPTQSFSCTGGSGQTAYGCAVLDGSGNLWFTFPFTSPVVFSSGLTYGVNVTLQEWAASVIP
jgi:hypothetical protein